MKFLIDFFPVLLFFITYQLTKSDNGQGDFFLATAVMLIATLIQFIILKLRGETIGKMHKINLALVLGLGLLTLLLQDKELFQWKVSILNWLFGLVFLASQFIGKKPIVQRMMESAIKVPQLIWNRLNMMWSLFFLSVGFLNLYVMKNFSESTWVDFKFYGLLGLTFGFIIAQGLYLGRHMISEEETNGEPPDS